MLGLNPVALAKGEVMKIDENHNHKPDAIEALEAVEKDLEAIGEFAQHFDAVDVQLILEMLPSQVKSKLPEGALNAAAVAIANLPKSCAAAEAKLKALEGWLQSK